MTTMITISKDHLNIVMHDWVLAHRAGECLGHEKADAMPADEVSTESTNQLWDALTALVTEEDRHG